MCCRKKPLKFFFLIFLVELELYFIGFIQFHELTVLLLKKNWPYKLRKKFCMAFSSEFYEPADIGKNILPSETYLSQKYIWRASKILYRFPIFVGINSWKFHKDLNACLKLIIIRLPCWPQKVKFSAKVQIFIFLTPWEIRLD